MAIPRNLLPKQLSNLSLTDLTPELVELARRHCLGPLLQAPRYANKPPAHLPSLSCMKYFTEEENRLMIILQDWCRSQKVFTTAEIQALVDPVKFEALMAELDPKPEWPLNMPPLPSAPKKD